MPRLFRKRKYWSISPIAKLTDSALKDQLAVISGSPKANAVALYAIMRNEIFFLPAFLSHYRSIGVQQFYILDDRSDDGTREYLMNQPDCVVLSSTFNFGDVITVHRADGSASTRRAGTFLKRAIPERFLANRWAVYVDADEFLILPPRFSSLADVVEKLERAGASCASAALIDFYPQHLQDASSNWVPRTFEDLVAHTPYFDALPFLRLRPGRFPRLCEYTASRRLFATWGIHEIPAPLRHLPDWVLRQLPLPVPRAAWYKTPLIKWDGRTWIDGSHRANVPPPEAPLLAAAHFKFTSDFSRKVTEALERKAHARLSRKYSHYERLIGLMRKGNSSFLGRHSKRYVEPEDLVTAGLLR